MEKIRAIPKRFSTLDRKSTESQYKSRIGKHSKPEAMGSKIWLSVSLYFHSKYSTSATKIKEIIDGKLAREYQRKEVVPAMAESLYKIVVNIVCPEMMWKKIISYKPVFDNS